MQKNLLPRQTYILTKLALLTIYKESLLNLYSKTTVTQILSQVRVLLKTVPVSERYCQPLPDNSLDHIQNDVIFFRQIIWDLYHAVVVRNCGSRSNCFDFDPNHFKLADPIFRVGHPVLQLTVFEFLLEFDYCMVQNRSQISLPRIFPVRARKNWYFALFLPRAHSLAAKGEKGMEVKFRREGIQKNPEVPSDSAVPRGQSAGARFC